MKFRNEGSFTREGVRLGVKEVLRRRRGCLEVRGVLRGEGRGGEQIGVVQDVLSLA